MSGSRLVTIAQIEGRVRGVGSEVGWRATCALPREKPQFSHRRSRPERPTRQRTSASTMGAKLATYIVEKGKSLVTLLE